MKTLRTAALVLAALSTAACMTPRVKVQPSEAILEARARAKAKPADACGRYVYTTTAPVTVVFAYNTTDLDPEARAGLDRLATWLTCNPTIYAMVSAVHDNQGSPDAQRRLIEARVAAIRQVLATAGVAPARILNYTPAEARGVLQINARGRGW